LPPNKSKPLRVQGTFVTSEEIRSLVDFIKGQGREPQYIDEITTKYASSKLTGGSGDMLGGGGGGGSSQGRDPLFDEVVKFVAREGKGTASSIQRKFSIGFTKAGRILDQMQEAGMVDAQQASKSREIHINTIMQYLRSKEQPPQT
jgi:S-DNA-T family DNA segregation ATPase FtsK/SpoIIIE